MSQQSGCVIIFFAVIFFAIFLGVFFGLLYPEIVINKDFLETSCLITNSTIDSFYCPSTSCTSCSDSSGLDTCSSVSSYMSSFDPEKCTVNNTQECPISPQQCSNGYKCCQTCCQTCTSCSTSCSSPRSDNHMKIQSTWKTFDESTNRGQCVYSRGSFYEGDSEPTDNCSNKTSFEAEGCTENCYSYQCNCYCCNSVSNLLCTITADICYNADLSIDYDTIDNTLVHTKYIQQFGTDLASAQNYIQNTYQISHSYECFYDTTDLSTIRWNIAYNSEYIAISVVFGTVSFICFVLGTHFILRDGYDETDLMKIESIFWFSVFVPLIILVPVLTSSPLSKSGRTIVVYFICQLTTLGFLPTCLLSHWTYGIVYILTIYLGIGIIVPSKSFIPVSNAAEFYGATICISIIAFVMCMWILHNIAQIQEIVMRVYAVFSPYQCWTLPKQDNPSASAPPVCELDMINQSQPPPSYESTLHISDLPAVNKDV